MGSKDKVKKEKPLEKMTSKELTVTALEIPEIIGVHGMNKPELISAIKKARGIAEDATKKIDASVREIKQKISALKTQYRAAFEGKDKNMAVIFRRRISRLKKKTRRAA
ncbi:MAG: transcription termination factor Rho [Deltaproteobacteria bacterium]|nr:transcription termination factor Rho [Deltaproteobacteria bacterium]